MDLLKNKGCTILNRCYMCKEEEQTIDHPPALLKTDNPVAANICTIWYRVDNSLFSKEGTPKLARIFSRELEEKNLEKCSLVPILDSME